jgi:hypothetical protein
MSIGYVVTVEQWMWELDLYQQYESYVRTYSGMYDGFEANPSGEPYDLFTFLARRADMQYFCDGLLSLGVPREDIRIYPIDQELK